MKNIAKLFIVTIMIISCGDFEPVVYDNVNGQTLAYFDRSTSNLEVIIDDVGSVDIKIGVTTLSTEERSLTVAVIPESTTAASNTYSFNPNVIIPPNSYFGTLTISGIDNNVETTAELITLKIESIEGNGIASAATHTVSIFQICPVASTSFVGNYLIEQTSPYVDGPTLSDGSVVTLSVGSSSTSRVFNTGNYTWYCSTPNPFTFSLVCNEVVPSVVRSNCACSADGLFFGPPINGAAYGTYDPNDDSVFFLIFGDDTTSDCGTPTNTTYKFTKQ